MNPKAPFSPYSPTRAEYTYLVSICKRHKINSVLEFGPGVSTLAFLEAGCTVESYEYDPKWVKEFAPLINNSKASISLFKNTPYLNIKTKRTAYDLAFVDTPTGGMYQVFSRLNSALFASNMASFLAIHDADRQGEKNTIRVLLELRWEIIESKHRIVLLKKNNSTIKLIPRGKRKPKPKF